MSQNGYEIGNRFLLETVGYRSVNLFTTALVHNFSVKMQHNAYTYIVPGKVPPPPQLCVYVNV